MSARKSSCKKCFYARKRYWYHLSTTLRKKRLCLIPWDEDKASNRSGTEPTGRRICVAPSIEQCITALPYFEGETYWVYRTAKRIAACKPEDIFDSNVTKEGWIQNPTDFVKIGKFAIADAATGCRDYIIPASASMDDPRYSGRVLSWWKKRYLHKILR